jgi:hypothetical protein
MYKSAITQHQTRWLRLTMHPGLAFMSRRRRPRSVQRRGRAATVQSDRPVSQSATSRRLIYSSCPAAPSLPNSPSRERRSFTNLPARRRHDFRRPHLTPVILFGPRIVFVAATPLPSRSFDAHLRHLHVHIHCQLRFTTALTTSTL